MRILLSPLDVVKLLQGCVSLPSRRRRAETLLASLLLLQHNSSSGVQQQQQQRVVCEALRIAGEALAASEGAPSPPPHNTGTLGGAPDPSVTLSRLATLAADAAAADTAAADTAAAAAGSSKASSSVLAEIAAVGKLLLRQHVLPHYLLLQQEDLVSLCVWHMALLLQPAAAATAAAATAAAAAARDEQLQGLLRALRGIAEAARKQTMETRDSMQLALVLRQAPNKA